MKSIAVFCGSSEGGHSVYRESAMELGRTLASRGITLVYGGAKVGLMGAVADAVLEQGGRVVGVLPHFLHEREVAHLRAMVLVDHTSEGILQQFSNYSAPAVKTYLNEQRT